MCLRGGDTDKFIFFFGGGGDEGGEYSNIAWEVTKNLRIVLLQAAMKSQLLQNTEQSC